MTFAPKHIFVDMDGVLTDFVGAAFRRIGRSIPLEQVQWNFNEQLGLSADDFWELLDGHDASQFWRGIDPYPWYRELLAALGDTPWCVLSTPSQDPGCVKGKVEWLTKHIAPDFRDYILTPRKHFAASPGAVLIDDNDENCAKFVEHGGRAILFPQPWNANRDKTEDRIGFLREAIVSHVYLEVLEA